MRRGSKTLVAALTALLLAAGLLACGGDDEGSSTTAAQAPTGKGPIGEGSGGGDAKADDGTKPAGFGGDATESSGDGGSDFVPKRHEDSGGGSEQYRVKGGDNSVQEFGAEAESSEFEAAAQALHNFLDARAAGDWDAACEYMSEATVASFERLGARGEGGSTSCGETLAGLINPNAKQALKEEAEIADVGSLRVEGEQAFVIYTGIDGTVMAMPMADEDGEWKVAGLAGTPLS
ncbi:MAG TPA: hypothetical protein VIS95_04490 [Solirubrobacterales bacterium]